MMVFVTNAYETSRSSCEHVGSEAAHLPAVGCRHRHHEVNFITKTRSRRRVRCRRLLCAIAMVATFTGCAGQWSTAKTDGVPGLHLEQRNEVSYRRGCNNLVRGCYNFDFYRRHNEAYRFRAAIHFAHGKAHDVPQLTSLDRASYVDRQFDAEAVHWIHVTPRIEPHMEYWGPHTAQGQSLGEGYMATGIECGA